RRRALENAGDVGAGAAIIGDGVAAVADQPAVRGELARVIDRGQRAAIRLRDKFIAPGAEEGVVGNEQRIGSLLRDAPKRRLDVDVCADRKDQDPWPMACAAARTSSRWSSEFGFFGLVRTAISDALGTNSRISSSRLPPSAA